MMSLLAFIACSWGWAGEKSLLDETDVLLGLKRPGAAVGRGASAEAGAAARRGGGVLVGVVDMRKVLMFHPLMATYLPEYGKFLRPLPKAAARLSEGRRRELMRRRYEKAVEEAKKLRELRKRLRGEEKKLLERLSLEQARLNVDIEKYGRQLHEASIKQPDRRGILQKDYSDKCSRRYDAYWKCVHEIEKRLVEIRKSLENINKKILSPNFLTEREARRLMARIEKEIGDAVEAVCVSRGVSLVLNSSALRAGAGGDGKARRRRRGASAGSLVVDENPVDLQYARNPYDAFLKSGRIRNTHDSLLVGNYLNEWLSSEELVDSELYAGGGLGAVVVRGGVDITRDVVKKLLEKYGLAAWKIRLVLSRL